jgi:hypothetical protein
MSNSEPSPIALQGIPRICRLYKFRLRKGPLAATAMRAIVAGATTGVYRASHGDFS